MALTQVKTSGIADDAVTSAKIPNDAIGSTELADDAITSALIADNAVGSSAIANEAVTFTKFENIEDGQILVGNGDNRPAERTLSGDVTMTNQGAVTIANNAVTLAKMAGGTDGQIITYDASGDPVAVGPGTDGQVLTSTGAGSPPAFEDAAGGGKVINSYGITNNSSTSATSSTWVDTGMTITLTPASVTSKFVIGVSQAISIYDTSTTATRGGWRLVRAISGGSATTITGDNAGVIYMQTPGTGTVMSRGKYAITALDDPDTTSAITYHTEIMEDQGNTTVTAGGNEGNSMFILELES